jgi:hypothetical protein
MIVGSPALMAATQTIIGANAEYRAIGPFPKGTLIEYLELTWALLASSSFFWGAGWSHSDSETVEAWTASANFLAGGEATWQGRPVMRSEVTAADHGVWRMPVGRVAGSGPLYVLVVMYVGASLATGLFTAGVFTRVELPFPVPVRVVEG